MGAREPGGPAVTVVVPTRNRARVLPTTLATILGQRDVELRVVVVDEGSSDDTPTFLRALGDERVEVVRHDEPRGLPAARNAGLARATTPIVAFCDDDDLWAPGKLAAQLAAMAATGARWACTSSVLVDGADLSIIGHQHVPAGGEALRELLACNPIPGGGSGVAAHADLVADAGGFDESLRASEDWDLWIRLAERSPLAVVDEPLVAYRVWQGSMSTDVDRMRSSFQQVLARRADRARDLGVAPRAVDYERFLAKQQLRAGDRFGAARTYLALVTRHRRIDQLPRAVGAVLAPGLTDRFGTTRSRRSLPAGWDAATAPWLADARTVEASPALAEAT